MIFTPYNNELSDVIYNKKIPPPHYLQWIEGIFYRDYNKVMLSCFVSSCVIVIKLFS